jgi:hypothetical protein
MALSAVKLGSTMRALALQPPALALSPELEWLLLRAFARNDAPAPQPGIDAQRAVALTRQFKISARIAGRTSAALLREELGDAASELASDHFTTAARDALLHDALAFAQAAAERIGAPLIGLKFLALRALGAARAGQRPAGDIDVLTPVNRARELHAALLAAGATESGVRGHAHQLPPVLAPHGVPIEIHLHIPGIALPGSKYFAVADELMAAGLVEQHAGLSTPAAPLVAAHAAAHGFLQNAGTPASHSLLSTLADLADLLALFPDALTRAAPYLAPRFDAEDCATLTELVHQLRAGNPTPGLVLRHTLALQLDPAYASSQRLRLLTQPLSDRPPALAVATALREALFPSPRELRAIYGDHLGHAPLTVRRLLRPFDLAWRVIRARADHLAGRP